MKRSVYSIYEVYRNGKLFKVFDGYGNALKFVSFASELLPDEVFTLRVRDVCPDD